MIETIYRVRINYDFVNDGWNSPPTLLDDQVFALETKGVIDVEMYMGCSACPPCIIAECSSAEAAEDFERKAKQLIKSKRKTLTLLR